jgi:NDP-sugar pyrophosphorylase family protein
MNLGVIAAGDGRRLKEEGINEPKPLIKVFGKTLLERVLDISKNYNFDSCNIIINEKFKEEVENSEIFEKYKEIKINCIYKCTPSSLHSLNALKPFLSGDSFCLMTIDSIFHNLEFKSFIKQVKEGKESDGLIAVTNFVDDEKPLWVNINSNNEIMGFYNSQKNSKLVTGGIYYFNKGIIEKTDIAISRNLHRLRNFLQYLTEAEVKLKAFTFGKIVDVDHRSDLIEAEKLLQQN